jgi:hypothetical protein
LVCTRAGHFFIAVSRHLLNDGLHFECELVEMVVVIGTGKDKAWASTLAMAAHTAVLNQWPPLPALAR